MLSMQSSACTEQVLTPLSKLSLLPLLRQTGLADRFLSLLGETRRTHHCKGLSIARSCIMHSSFFVRRSKSVRFLPSTASKLRMSRTSIALPWVKLCSTKEVGDAAIETIQGWTTAAARSPLPSGGLSNARVGYGQVKSGSAKVQLYVA